MINLILQFGRQEDAEEFLSSLLNGLHDEMIAAIKVANQEDNSAATNGDCNNDEEAADDSGWEQVGPKNKSVITRSVVSVQSHSCDIIFDCLWDINRKTWDF